RYLCYRIDLPNDDAAADLLRDVLKALDRRFTDASVKIDAAMFNASRIIRLFGTTNRKGPDTPERPHRRSGILRIPKVLQVVSTDLLEALAAEGRKPEPPRERAAAARTAAEHAPAPAESNGRAGANGTSPWVGVSAAEDYRARGPDWGEILEGWTLTKTCPDGERRWTRPGKDSADGISATTGHAGQDCFHVFSDQAAPFAPNATYSKFQAYALLNHGGDASAAAKALYEDGYGARQPPPPPTDDDRPGWHKDRVGYPDDAPPGPPMNGRHDPEANGQAGTPAPEPIDGAALRKRAGEFQKLSDLTDDVGWLDALARLEVTDPDEANRILTFAQDVLGKKKWAAKPVKIALAGPRKAARRRDAPRETPRAGLPEILVDRPIHEVIADAVACLTTDPEVFRRGPNLVRMIRNEKPPKGLKGTEGTPQIAVIPATRLVELLSRSALWVRERTNPEGDPILVATDPTATHASLVKDRCDWPGIRILERVTEAPCLRTDGTILQEPGYDPDTGLFFLPHPGVTFPEIPEHPTIEDARAAAATLLDLVVDFPFARPEGTEEEDSPHTYAWLASLLTILCRSAIDGPCPLFLFTANTAGSGKTKLCDLSALIATGRKMPRSDYTDNNEEMAKVLFSIALGGFPVVFLDNVGSGGALGGSAIDKALTSTALNGRLLGASEMRDVPFHAVLFATGNNVRLQGDIHRRIIPCRLESPDEHPEERDNFAIKDLEGHVLRNRPALVAAGLTIVRAYVVAGCPDQELTPMDFPAWCGLIRNAIHWATGFDPCATRAGARDDDGEANELRQLVVA
ncbi:MAG: hypothetical protein JO252_25845, partial [Planctomycetaceae bacterium]|nr:hypothetical protein [Planctomycetaceae bacterium]